jgi:TonB-dependent receptor
LDLRIFVFPQPFDWIASDVRESRKIVISKSNGRGVTVSDKLKIIAFSLILVNSAVPIAAFGQDDSESGSDDEPESVEPPRRLEEVLVTGIRVSLTRSMDMKRYSQGVVEGISAEDMGKFPDTNLAESLQRVTGVSIDRSNNEGSKVTVRGFGPEFNLVTLNGRTMPTSQLGSSTRSFDFANIASEGVSSVEVYKTFSAVRSSGGIGSTININTARPLDKPGLAFSLGGKALQDTTNEEGDDITPEFSGIFSNTFANDTIGVGAFYSSQERDSRQESGVVQQWRENIHDVVAGNLAEGATITDNRTDPDGNTWYPRNFNYSIADTSRKRTNGQVVFQFAPNDAITATLDYTHSKVETETDGINAGIWFAPESNSVLDATIDKNGTFTYTEEATGDYASVQRSVETENENDSLGLNLQWQVNDSLSLAFDAHDSEAVSEGAGGRFGNNTFIIFAANNVDTKSANFGLGDDLPTREVTFREEAPIRGVLTPYPGMVDGLPTAASYDSQFARASDELSESDVSQFQLSGVWENSDADSALVSIGFGLASTDYTFRTRTYNTGVIPLGFYGGNQALFPDELFERESLSSTLDEFSGGAGNIDPDFYYSYDFEGVVAIAEENLTPRTIGIERNDDFLRQDHEVQEETVAAYLQFNAESTFRDMPVRINGGLRYEQTDVTAGSLQNEPEALVWLTFTEWSTEIAGDRTISTATADYDEWLPNVDFAIDVRDDVIARLSYSKSITRPTLQQMQATTTVTQNPVPGSRNADVGNPGLEPFSSDNFDFSVEWYFGEASYVSLGAFHKEVDNFIVSTTVDSLIGDLRDPQNGPRAAQAEEDLAAMPGSSLTVHDQININAGQPVGTPILQNDQDPLAPFRATTPTNQETATLYGYEAALQYMFGDSGFGFQANATIVEGDIDVDPSVVGFQFALPGLSDSANLIGFYDKHGFQARFAYNWRDEYLSSITQNQPIFAEEYGQLDMNISYQPKLVEGLTVFLEGINVTDESQRVYNRYSQQLVTANQFGARYALGFRYTF